MRDIPGARPPAPKDLVRIRDRLTFLYVERCTVHRDSNAITVTDARGVAHVPAAALSVLMIGPGVRVTHSAMSVLSESGATTVWVGENGVRYYAHGVPPSRSSRLLEAQAKAVSDPVLRASVARQMYLMRFQGENVENLSIQQLRGREGARVRRLYRRSSKRTGVPWDGREYDPNNFDNSSLINQALSASNSALYGLIHAVIVALGWVLSIPVITVLSCMTSLICIRLISPYLLPLMSPWRTRRWELVPKLGDGCGMPSGKAEFWNRLFATSRSC